MINACKNKHGQETQIQPKVEGGQRRPRKGDDFNLGLKGCIGVCHMEKGSKVIPDKRSGIFSEIINGHPWPCLVETTREVGKISWCL